MASRTMHSRIPYYLVILVVCTILGYAAADCLLLMVKVQLDHVHDNWKSQQADILRKYAPHEFQGIDIFTPDGDVNTALPYLGSSTELVDEFDNKLEQFVQNEPDRQYVLDIEKY